jgi:hypothetical protein
LKGKIINSSNIQNILLDGIELIDDSASQIDRNADNITKQKKNEEKYIYHTMAAQGAVNTTDQDPRCIQPDNARPNQCSCGSQGREKKHYGGTFPAMFYTPVC